MKYGIVSFVDYENIATSVYLQIFQPLKTDDKAQIQNFYEWFSRRKPSSTYNE